MLFQDGMLERLEHFAVQMSKGKATLPAHLQGNPADCMAITMQAAQWKMNPFAVAQKTHLVNGTLGYEAQLVNAVISSSKAIQGRFKYEWSGEGDNLTCKVGAVLAGDSAPTWGAPVRLKDQTVKNSPLWKTDPKQQLAYLAVKKWARLYTPDVILGVYTPEELETVERNMGPAEVVDLETGEIKSATASVKAKLKTQAETEKKPEPVVIEVEPEIDYELAYETLIHDLADCDTEEKLAELKDLARALYPTLEPGKKSTLTKTIKAAEEDLKAAEGSDDDEHNKDLF